jgi:hypothetical protein
MDDFYGSSTNVDICRERRRGAPVARAQQLTTQRLRLAAHKDEHQVMDDA